MTCVCACWENEINYAMQSPETPPAWLPQVAPPENSWQKWNVAEMSPAQCAQAADEVGDLQNWQIAKIVAIWVVPSVVAVALSVVLLEVTAGLIVSLVTTILLAMFTEITGDVFIVAMVASMALLTQVFLTIVVFIGHVISKVIFPMFNTTTDYYIHLDMERERLEKKANQAV